MTLMLGIPVFATGLGAVAAPTPEPALAPPSTAQAAGVIARTAVGEAQQPSAAVSLAEGDASRRASLRNVDVGAARAGTASVEAVASAVDGARAEAVLLASDLPAVGLRVGAARAVARSVFGVGEGSVEISGVTLAGAALPEPVPANTALALPGGRLVLRELIPSSSGFRAAAAHWYGADGSEIILAFAEASSSEGGLAPSPAGSPTIRARATDVEGSALAGASVEIDVRGAGTSGGSSRELSAAGEVRDRAASGAAEVALGEVELLGGLVVARGLRSVAGATADRAAAAPAAAASVASVTISGVTTVSPAPGRVFAIPGVGSLVVAETDVARIEDPDSSRTRATAVATALTLTLLSGNTIVVGRSEVEAFAPREPLLRLSLADEPALVHVGDPVAFRYRVDSIGTATVVAGTVRDDDHGVVCEIRNLRPGASLPCSRVATVEADLAHVATATGVDAWGNEARATAAGFVRALAPSLSLAVVPSPSVAHPGDDVTVRYLLHNDGNAPLRDIRVESTLVPGGCPSELAPGERGACEARTTADETVAVAATASGRDELGRISATSHEAGLRVLRPAIAVTVIAPAYAHDGDTVRMSVAATNVGDAPLRRLEVTSREIGTHRWEGTLKPGESVTICDLGIAVVGELSVSVLATGDDELDHRVAAAAVKRIAVLHPAVDVAVAVEPARAHSRDRVNVTYTATNTGDARLVGLTIRDEAAGPICQIGSLDPGASATCARRFTIVDDSIVRAVAEAQDELGLAVTRSASAAVDVLHPAIAVQASASPPEIRLGGSTAYAYSVTNVGDTRLLDVRVVDASLGEVCAIPALEAGAASVCRAAALPDASDTRIVRATGRDELGLAVAATTPLTITVIDPRLALTLTPERTLVPRGATAYATAVATNVGDTLLLSVAVRDASGRAPCEPVDLRPGEAATCRLAYVLDATSDVRAAADARDRLGGLVVAEAFTTIMVADGRLSATLTASPEVIRDGTSSRLTLVAVNTGNVPLDGVRLAFGTRDSVPCDFARVEVGARITCDTTVSPRDTTDFGAAASGLDPFGAVVGSSALARVTVLHPALSLAATATPDRFEHFGKDRLVGIRYVATNVGDVLLGAVAIRDAATGADCRAPSLSPGAVLDCTVGTLVGRTTGGTAQAVATDPLGGAVLAEAPWLVTVTHPAIAAAVVASPNPAQRGETVRIVATVVNAGDVDLADVVLRGPAGTPCAVGALPRGASVTCEATRTMAGTTTETWLAEGTTPLGARIGSTASTTVLLAEVAATLRASPSAVELVGRDLAARVVWSYGATNVGDAPLAAVVVDDLRDGRLCGPADLDPGRSLAPCDLETVLSATTTRTAQATGRDAGGRLVSGVVSTTVVVTRPSVSLALLATPNPLHRGETLTLDYQVANTGDAALSGLQVADDALGAICSIASLAAGTSATCRAVTSSLSAPTTFRGTVVASTPLGNTLAASAQTLVEIASLIVTSTPDRPVAEILPGQTAATIVYTYVVRNDGSTDVGGVSISDSRLGAICSVGLVPVGESRTCTRSTTVTATTTTTATASGLDLAKRTVTDTGTATVVVTRPALGLTATATPSIIGLGESSTLRYTVSNTGDVTLRDIVVRDGTVEVCRLTGLGVGQSTSCTRAVAPRLTTTYTGTATALTPLGNTISRSASVTVTVR